MQYLFLSAGGVDARQTGLVQEATVVQTDADEVGGAVRGGAHQHAATGNEVVHLGGGKHSRHRNHSHTTGQ